MFHNRARGRLLAIADHRQIIANNKNVADYAKQLKDISDEYYWQQLIQNPKETTIYKAGIKEFNRLKRELYNLAMDSRPTK